MPTIMNRRGFLKSILAAGVAPYVVTTAGVLMPVRQLWKPNGEYFVQAEFIGATFRYLRAVGTVVAATCKIEVSGDGVHWVALPPDGSVAKIVQARNLR